MNTLELKGDWNIVKGKLIHFNRFIIVFFAAALLGLAGAGCKHTAHGGGQDIEQMGDKIQEKTQ